MNMQMRCAMSPVPEGQGRSHHTAQLTSKTLEAENSIYKNSGGISQENSCLGFHPAFFDADTGLVYLSRFADGRVAPMHLLEGLPKDVVTQRTAKGKVKAIKPSVAAGFVLGGRFYTREQAASVVTKHKGRKIA